MSSTLAPSDADRRRWPFYWFVQLESAIEAGDLAGAATAQKQLEKLGLRVELLPPWQRKGGGDAA